MHAPLARSLAIDLQLSAYQAQIHCRCHPAAKYNDNNAVYVFFTLANNFELSDIKAKQQLCIKQSLSLSKPFWLF
jgi:hypothetical protein